VYDLSNVSDFQQVLDAFPECATTHFQYNGGTFALPETITFPMMFYRTDIVAEKGWTLPETWDDVYALLPDMQKINMNFGYIISSTIDASPYVNFLYQNNGNLYKNNDEQSGLDSPQAIDAFIEWTDLYTTYQFDRVLDFSNRFRRGELPIGIYDYINGYNTLTLSAPEIRGLWTMTVLPGHRRADGTVNNTAAATVTGCVLLNQSRNKENAWKFMKWWTGTDSQVRYSQEVESVLGAGARNATANINALRQLSWTNNELSVILSQLEHTKGIPQVPGGYYSYRHIYNGYIKAAVNGEDQRETLLDLVEDINNELYNKRKEYGLSLPDRN
jgi:ABC-type glycerol-3-phosphate transport system substrate-binding protein